MATRLLLTLLALLAGLAAQLTPAQARGGAAVGVEIGAVTLSPENQRASTSQLQVHELQVALDQRQTTASVAVSPWSAVVVASVLPGIDRAHE